MRKSTMSILFVAVVLVAGIVASGPRSTAPADAAPAPGSIFGYSMVETEGGCELVTVDWATGAVTDLPAAPSPDACAFDLAVGPDGVVRGVVAESTLLTSIDAVSDRSIASVTPLGSLITFAVDGTPSYLPLTPPADYAALISIYSMFPGIAVSADGTVFVTLNGLWANVTTCAPSGGIGDTGLESIEPTDGDVDWTSCLFTLDPTTGALTLVGPSRRPTDDLAGLSIGSDASWILMLPGTHTGPVSTPSSDTAGGAVLAYWSRIDRTTGEVTPTGVTYDPSAGALFDQFRDGAAVYAFVDDETLGGWMTATVDPTSGAITRIAHVANDDLRAMLAIAKAPPAPEPATPKFTG